MIAARPLTIAEIFDRAVTLLVRRWRAAGAIAVIGATPETVRTALVAADLRFALRQPLLMLLLQILAAATLIYTLAALAMLFAGDDDDASALALYRTALASFWRLLRVAIVTSFLLGVCALAFGIMLFVSTLIAPAAFFVAALAAVVLIVPPGFVLQIALVDAALEGTGATTSVGTAFRRACAQGAAGRTAWLAYAVAIAYFAPQLVVTSAAQFLAVIPGFRWVVLIMPPLNALTGLLFAAAVCTVAAVDYRVRHEGADLEAVLDAAEPA
jgi:hypothetical protein